MTKEAGNTVIVEIDSLVWGFIGFTEKSAKGRVFHVSPWGWVAFYDEERKQQHISYAGRFLVKGEPRPESKRAAIPAHLRGRVAQVKALADSLARA